MLLDFELDPKIIHHIIFSQAGSVGKAIIELVMNSVDANASKVSISISAEGFYCQDDGCGFANIEDVKRYFGRFGTPHAEGDATYGRFRLGRGQIMAHASTQWSSNYWRMNVDTPVWGYKYDLNESAEKAEGCRIQGQWYEPLPVTELMSTLQEIRDLIRYTSIVVELNGEEISRNPYSERWDLEDDYAFYRVKAEGAVFIYNQGVLVRPDSGHLWGVGGVIVTKKPIDLNVSRTDILRKTCPVWKEVAKSFKGVAEKFCSELGDRRKTESRREKAAKDLLAGVDENMWRLYSKEEVITLLPGKKHVSLNGYVRECNYADNNVTVIENGRDIPKGESIALSRLAVVIHPDTLSRFSCHSVTEFKEVIQRINGNFARTNEKSTSNYYYKEISSELLDFEVLKNAFVEKTRIMLPAKTLDKYTRKIWGALSYSLWRYVIHCQRSMERRGDYAMQILLGESTHATAWTDGRQYIAINVDVVKQLTKSPMQTACYIFSLVLHELSHEGDSIDAGHDEAFYQRYHDLSIQFSESRQDYMRIFTLKYAQLMEREKNFKGRIGQDIFLNERVAKGRAKRGLPDSYQNLNPEQNDLSNDIPDDLALIADVNRSLSKTV